MNAPRLPPALLALSPGDLTPAQLPAFLARTAAALGAGLRAVLLREALLGDALFLALARDLRARLDEVGGWLGVHDRAHLVPSARADGLHLGFRSLRVREARELVGPGLAIGLSTHAGDEPRSWAGADYRFYGPVGAVAGKGTPLGARGIAAAAHGDATPLLALGGIDPPGARELASTGARGVAVLSGLLAAPDPAAAARAYLDAWGASASSGAPGGEGR